MLSRTHLLAGFIAGLIIVKTIDLAHPYIFILIFTLFSIMPDIDSSHSVVGRKVWPVSKLIEVFLGHRGIMHSIFVPLVILGVSWYYGYLWIGCAAAGGYMIHLLTDALTKGGVRFLGPLGHRNKGFIRTGGILEGVLFLILFTLLLKLVIG